jgi:hypothetical protein
MLIVATLPSTFILYLWAVFVWQWYNRFCLSETRLKWYRRSKVRPNARCVPSYDFSTRKVNVQRKFTNKLLLFMVKLWIGKMWRSGAVNSLKEGLMFTTNIGAVGHLWSLFKEQAADFYDSGIQKLVPRLNKCLDNAGDYVQKWSYVQAIHSQCRFCKLKMFYMVQTFVSLLYGHFSYIVANCKDISFNFLGSRIREFTTPSTYAACL